MTLVVVTTDWTYSDNISCHHNRIAAIDLFSCSAVLSQVIVASTRKLSHKLPLNGEELYEVEGKESETNSMRILHTNGFK